MTVASLHASRIGLHFGRLQNLLRTKNVPCPRGLSQMPLVNTAPSSHPPSLYMMVSDRYRSITWTLLLMSTYPARRRIAP